MAATGIIGGEGGRVCVCVCVCVLQTYRNCKANPNHNSAASHYMVKLKEQNKGAFPLFHKSGKTITESTLCIPKMGSIFLIFRCIRKNVDIFRSYLCEAFLRNLNSGLCTFEAGALQFDPHLSVFCSGYFGDRILHFFPGCTEL
jgi:hypothetical protein